MKDASFTKDEMVAIRRTQKAADICLATLLDLPSVEETCIALRTVINAFIVLAAVTTDRPPNNVMTELFDSVIACNEEAGIAYVKLLKKEKKDHKKERKAQ